MSGFIKLNRSAFRSPAMKTLTTSQMVVLLMFMDKFNGFNNGDLHVSCREAKDRGVGKSTLYGCIAALVTTHWLSKGKVKIVGGHRCHMYTLNEQMLSPSTGSSEPSVRPMDSPDFESGVRNSSIRSTGSEEVRSPRNGLNSPVNGQLLRTNIEEEEERIRREEDKEKNKTPLTPHGSFLGSFANDSTTTFNSSSGETIPSADTTTALVESTPTSSLDESHDPDMELFRDWNSADDDRTPNLKSGSSATSSMHPTAPLAHTPDNTVPTGDLTVQELRQLTDDECDILFYHSSSEQRAMFNSWLKGIPLSPSPSAKKQMEYTKALKEKKDRANSRNQEDSPSEASYDSI
jgi:hypothetical protein